MGSALFPLFKLFYGDEPPARQSELAWRTVCVVPALLAISTGVVVLFISEDAPKGNYRELKKLGAMSEISAAASFRSGAVNLNTWILFVHYACCLGVDLTMYNGAALYFRDRFGLSTEAAAAIASITGWMNLFSRGLGGYVCDKANARFGMRGRLWVHTIMLLGEGVMIIIFANMNSLAGSVVTMVVFALFGQAAEGTTYSVCRVMNPIAPSTC